MHNWFMRVCYDVKLLSHIVYARVAAYAIKEKPKKTRQTVSFDLAYTMKRYFQFGRSDANGHRLATRLSVCNTKVTAERNNCHKLTEHVASAVQLCNCSLIGLSGFRSISNKHTASFCTNACIVNSNNQHCIIGLVTKQ